MSQPAQKPKRRDQPDPCYCPACCAADPRRAAMRIDAMSKGRMRDLRGRPR